MIAFAVLLCRFLFFKSAYIDSSSWLVCCCLFESENIVACCHQEVPCLGRGLPHPRATMVRRIGKCSRPVSINVQFSSWRCIQIVCPHTYERDKQHDTVSTNHWREQEFRHTFAWRRNSLTHHNSIATHTGSLFSFNQSDTQRENQWRWKTNFGPCH